MHVTASPQTRQAMYVLTYSECMFVASGIQHAMCTRHTVICGMPGSTIFSALSHKRTRFSKKLLNIKCVLILLITTFVWNIPHSSKKWTRR